MSSSKADTERLPLAGKIPERDILIEVFDRVTLLSDELNDPDGLLSVSLKSIRAEAEDRHQEMKALMNRVLDEVLDVRSRVDALEDQLGDPHITVQ